MAEPECVGESAWNNLLLYDRCLSDGRAAYANGLGIDECPHHPGSPERCAWMDGYDG